MLKRLINSVSIDLTISPVDPLLIKSGQATVGGVDMSFVRTRRAEGQDDPYLPGSSLKGIIRSYSEKICRSIKPDSTPVCLPYVRPGQEGDGEHGQASCGLRFEEYKKRNKLSTRDAYHFSCPVCRLFGSHVFTGRYQSADAYLVPDSNPVFEIRDGVAIDRLTGGVASGPFDFEVLVRGEFSTTIEIQNFERWQLGLVALVLRDMEQELVRIGSGTSRGLGRVKAEITSFSVSYFGSGNGGTLAGLGSLCSDQERADYGFFTETTSGGSLPEPRRVGLRQVHDLTAEWKELMNPAVDDLVAFVTQINWPGALDAFVNRR